MVDYVNSESVLPANGLTTAKRVRIIGLQYIRDLVQKRTMNIKIFDIPAICSEEAIEPTNTFLRGSRVFGVDTKVLLWGVLLLLPALASAKIDLLGGVKLKINKHDLIHIQA